MNLNKLEGSLSRLSTVDSLQSIFEHPAIDNQWNSANEIQKAILDQKPRIQIIGLTNSAKALLFARLYTQMQEPFPWIIVTASREEGLNILEDLKSWLPSVPKFFFPSWESLPGDSQDPDRELLHQRQLVFHQLVNSEPVIIIASLIGILQATAPRHDWQQKKMIFQVGQNVKEDFKSLLVGLGYEQVSQVLAYGQFAIRGGILDIVPLGDLSGPVRIELFGSTIESIQKLDLNSQRSSQKIQQVMVLSAREVDMNDTIRQIWHKLWNQNLENPSMLETQHILFETTGSFPGIGWKILQTHPKPGYWFDYLPSTYRLFLINPSALERQAEQLQKRLQEVETVENENKIGLKPVTHLFESIERLHQLWEQGHAICLSQLPQSFHHQEALDVFEIHSQSIPPFYGKFSSFLNQLKRWKNQSHRVMIWCHNAGEKKRLGELLMEAGFYFENQAHTDAFLQLKVGEIEHSFSINELNICLISDHDLFRRYRGHLTPSHHVQTSTKTISNLNELTQDCVTVHVDCGICRYRGLTLLTIDGVQQEYVQLEFADAEKLYLPVNQLNQIQKYMGAEFAPALTKLGGSQWTKAKAKAKQEIETIARELLDLYSRRKSVKKKPFLSDTPWQHEFEDSFEYPLTLGQHQSLVEIKKDMEQDKPMDRLVCGDVGYGKTEVAIRAAFKAVQEQKQVAVLVPTTILAQQHFIRFKERMAEYPVQIGLLSRFKTPKEQKEILKHLRAGQVDIVIGTHRLLKNDIQFKDLGLLIIDEEHRFGVAQKERLKSIRQDVDVLTLTATPIPRTLHMALSGIRDISVIETPPRNRRAVILQIHSWNEQLIQEAIQRELHREGQVFYVHNHVRDIMRSAEVLHRLVPTARIAVAHGQLAEYELESIMGDFLDHQYDILICTSIIESGLDLPNVNTILVERADQLGLSQLYQLKGRVGRTDRQAYAYFFYPKPFPLKELAQKRLEVLQEFSALGSGIHIAMKDLEIRGAGNVLGIHQHGNLEAIGFELYHQMLNQEMGKSLGIAGKEEDIQPILSLSISAFFPSEYISDEVLKIEFYRRLTLLETQEQIDDYQEELRDRFGALPLPVILLLKVVALKPILKSMGIIRMERSEGWVLIQWHSKKQPVEEQYTRWMRQWPPARLRFSSKEPNQVSFWILKNPHVSDEQKLESIRNLLRDLQ